MAHNVMIDGTAYTIKGGRTLVDGTAYAISKGRTMVDGTGYDVSFMPSLEELLSSASIFWIEGTNSRSFRYVSHSVAEKYTYTLSMCLGYMSVNKPVGGGSNKWTKLQQMNASYGNIYTNDNNHYYSHSGGSSTTTYGATLVALKFPFEDEVVDKLLASTTLTRISGWEGGSKKTVSGTVENGLVVCACDTNFTIYKGDTPILSTDTQAATVSGTTYSCGDVYGASIIQIT